uniref:non-specific serine/threonine protein kinase n=1 Tax=Zooxanthella nutricula TaxID=1333877 RepID=A0A7S2JXS4_9DINO
MLPCGIVEGGIHFGRDVPPRSEPGKVILVMSYDNIAALSVILSLSILGAIYLWKICTRRRCLCRVCQNQYRQMRLIGSGGYGSVYLVERLHDGVQFVSKKILVRDITEVDEYSKEAKELVTLRHRHIVSYEEDFVHVEYGALEPKTYFIIVMEYCPEGDLKEKIEQDFCSFTEEWVRTVFAQLLQAVQYLHSKNVIHRDLKSQNVFLAEDGHVRLGDFGLCRHTRNPALGSATFSHAGTDCYMAPEMLNSSRYGKPADMWSMGCVLYELCTGQFMWELDGILGAMVMADTQIVHKLLRANVVPAVGNALRSLLRRLLNAKPEGRPTATTCIRKKLFKKASHMSRELFGDQLGDGSQGDVGDRDSSPQGASSGSGRAGQGDGLEGGAGIASAGSGLLSGAHPRQGTLGGATDDSADACSETTSGGEEVGGGRASCATSSDEDAALQRTESALARKRAQRRRRRTYRR